MSPPANGQPRREAILSLLVPAGLVVDVGCDHGHIAAAIQARGFAVVATERRRHRLPERADVPRVVADGLEPFRTVDLAVITGMGPHAILDILARGPAPRVAIVHTPDRTDTLRQGLADAGWRIDAERLAPEGHRFAEVIRVVRGEEPHEGHALWFGPGLRDDPLLPRHAASVRAHWTRVAARAPEGSPGHARAVGWLAFLDAEGL
ncbi:MAG: tRNA (adenine(22)-N(1))-methyltransferase TrmK [Alphaproteobacteria bacterium]|nr:tRNA (adenine(22)-N(1))-methyltransferase TrmK [Alphaproteobacteria bacterium]